MGGLSAADCRDCKTAVRVRFTPVAGRFRASIEYHINPSRVLAALAHGTGNTRDAHRGCAQAYEVPRHPRTSLGIKVLEDAVAVRPWRSLVCSRRIRPTLFLNEGGIPLCAPRLTADGYGVGLPLPLALPG